MLQMMGEPLTRRARDFILGPLASFPSFPSTSATTQTFAPSHNVKPKEMGGRYVVAQ